MVIEISDPEQLSEAAIHLLHFIGNEKILLFYGEMGAGKTTFIKAICKELGITDTVSSPTFSIVNEYVSPSGPVYHFDFYRLKNETEALDLGYEDYIYSGNYCFIEWPEKISSLLPAKACRVELKVKSGQERLLQAEIVSF
ncbi:tRNA (adenosine(37)-N6)-threonylcarbamoyltransferase complex ATPase subunit type 1 TsaE [Rubrolithibacter danxiaensis]|uniref:tRNA (adenosine(37)-N6)-threonylcarbamoyltransferase complex ATPase subunit type 1 TsaE n=1 Tax=Rubrolithibacter danxiaensis TaxID=3390805 RepID=UPI003BF91F2E